MCCFRVQPRDPETIIASKNVCWKSWSEARHVIHEEFKPGPADKMEKLQRLWYAKISMLVLHIHTNNTKRASPAQGEAMVWCVQRSEVIYRFFFFLSLPLPILILLMESFFPPPVPTLPRVPSKPVENAWNHSNHPAFNVFHACTMHLHAVQEVWKFSALHKFPARDTISCKVRLLRKSCMRTCKSFVELVDTALI